MCPERLSFMRKAFFYAKSAFPFTSRHDKSYDINCSQNAFIMRTKSSSIRSVGGKAGDFYECILLAKMSDNDNRARFISFVLVNGKEL